VRGSVKNGILSKVKARHRYLLGYSLIMNHPFVDGNKRIGHAAMETFLVLDGFEIDATVDEQEQIILRVASGELKREDFTKWLRDHIAQRSSDM